MPEVLLTQDDVRRRLGVTQPTVSNLIRSGLLPSVRTGFKQRKVRESALEAFMASSYKEGEPTR